MFLTLNVVENSEFFTLPIERIKFTKEDVLQLLTDSKDEYKKVSVTLKTLMTMVKWVTYSKTQKKMLDAFSQLNNQ